MGNLVSGGYGCHRATGKTLMVLVLLSILTILVHAQIMFHKIVCNFTQRDMGTNKTMEICFVSVNFTNVYILVVILNYGLQNVTFMGNWTKYRGDLYSFF